MYFAKLGPNVVNYAVLPTSIAGMFHVGAYPILSLMLIMIDGMNIREWNPLWYW